jgi:predicted MFS family arabinose efflux permease
MIALFRRPPVVAGLLAVMLLFIGQFALYTYLRPFLEQVTHASVTTLSTMLLIVGVAGFVGTTVIGRVLDHRLHVTLGVLPAIMAAVAVGLAILGGSTWMTAGLLAIWGFVSTAAPVAWWTWLTRTAPDNAEVGGGLMVAVIQLAITLGATIGGVAYDAVGAAPEFLGSAAILALAALTAFGSAVVHGRRAQAWRAAEPSTPCSCAAS